MSITGLGIGVLRIGRPLVVRGIVTNNGPQAWTDAVAHLQITPTPATSPQDLSYYASIPDDPGLGNTIYDTALSASLGRLRPGSTREFTLRVPYDDLGIDSLAGVYRVGVTVVGQHASLGGQQADAAHAATLMPLLPVEQDIAPVETVTLLPLSAPVKRLSDGVFDDDSLRLPLAPGGRLSNVLDWLATAPTGTVQIAIDPALLRAITDMSNGYRVRKPGSTSQTVPGQGREDAAQWLQLFHQLEANQYVLYLPWGEPAANSLLDQHTPGPVVAAVRASAGYRGLADVAPQVAGWLRDGSTSLRSLTLMRRQGAGVPIVSERSLPGLASYREAGKAVPGHVVVEMGNRNIHTLVTTSTLAGLPTTAATSALQFRQRLISDVTMRSLTGQTQRVAVTALPFFWNPGTVLPGQGTTQLYNLPVIVPASAIGAMDRPGTPYRGAVRPPDTDVRGIAAGVITSIKALRTSAGALAGIVQPAEASSRTFYRMFAMSGSAEWAAFPLTGMRLIDRHTATANHRLAQVRITGPPFVAMSSDTGRFPLTVTNGLKTSIVVTIAVTPQDPALSVAPIAPFTLDPDEQRDVQVRTTASGSGVTSVNARLATAGGLQFGRAWQFDVRSTQIGLVIWIVMGVGAAVLLIASGYRIVNRIRGRERGTAVGG